MSSTSEIILASINDPRRPAAFKASFVPPFAWLHPWFHLGFDERSNLKLAPSITLRWVTILSSPEREGEDVRAANRDTDGGLKYLRASSVFGGTTLQKDAPEAPDRLSDLWRLISFILILRRGR